jgi:hypothetical protein
MRQNGLNVYQHGLQVGDLGLDPAQIGVQVGGHQGSASEG